jgi:hypothetical protein
MFTDCKTPEEAKNLFRRLALRLHPDHGGDADLMVLLRKAYDEFIRCLEMIHKGKKESPPKKDEDWIKRQEENPKYPIVDKNIHAGDEILKIMDDIFEAAEHLKNFKTNYCESIYENLEKNGYLTSTQYNTLVKIYYSWRMDQPRKNKTE